MAVDYATHLALEQMKRKDMHAQAAHRQLVKEARKHKQQNAQHTGAVSLFDSIRKLFTPSEEKRLQRKLRAATR